MIALDRLEMLGLMQQQVGLSGSNESLDAGKWTEDMRKVASWLSNTPLSELEQRPSLDDLQEPVHQPNEAGVPEWELESASNEVSDASLSLSGSEEEENGENDGGEHLDCQEHEFEGHGEEDEEGEEHGDEEEAHEAGEEEHDVSEEEERSGSEGQSEESFEQDMTEYEHMEASYMSFLDFTEDLMRLDRKWYEEDVDDIGVDMLTHGVGRFAGDACMRKLEESIFSACRAGMGAPFVKRLLLLLKANPKWEKVILGIIQTAIEEPLDDETLDVLESATSESFPSCAFILRFLRGKASELEIQEAGLRGFKRTTLLQWELNCGLSSIMEDTDEDNIRKAIWHWFHNQRHH